MFCTVVGNKIKCMLDNNKSSNQLSNMSLFSFVVAIVVMYLIMLLVLQYAWNNVMPELFGIRQITLLQALFLTIVSAILVK